MKVWVTWTNGPMIRTFRLVHVVLRISYWCILAEHLSVVVMTRINAGTFMETGRTQVKTYVDSWHGPTVLLTR